VGWVRHTVATSINPATEHRGENDQGENDQ
jgi:hypothetical protein